MQRNYKRPFIQFVKKAHKPLKLAIEDAVDLVCDTPDICGVKSLMLTTGTLVKGARPEDGWGLPVLPGCCRVGSDQLTNIVEE
jgi:hypothetical protein